MIIRMNESIGIKERGVRIWACLLGIADNVFFIITLGFVELRLQLAFLLRYRTREAKQEVE